MPISTCTTIFSVSMRIHLRGQCLMSTFQYLLWYSCPIRSLGIPTERMVFLLIQICNRLRGLYLVNELATMAELFEEFAQQQMEGCSGFVFSEDLWRHFLWVLHCFGVFWTISHIDFKADILPTCDFFDLSERKVSLASQALSISTERWSHIGYEYWKRSALRKGLAYKHKQKQMQPSSNKLALFPGSRASLLPRTRAWELGYEQA